MVILRELVQGSSSGSHDHNNYNKQRYDVFLSFRGSDTRLRFTAHLYDALVKADITTFLDDEEIETGENLKPEIEDAIRSSRASVIVLSKNYATSTWCLDELVLILDQHSHIVIPIFYDVEPTDVRKQLNSFGDAMRDHRRKMEEETNQDKRDRWAQKIDRWSQALTDVANLKGRDIKDRREPDFIEEIVTTIRQTLSVPLSGTLPLLIGRNRELKEITSWLTDGSSSNTVDILTVFGMGGIGKTSLAKYVFHLHFRTFAKICFIESINSKCTEKFDGLPDVQKQLYDVISKMNKRPVKVFVVLDDIDSLKQLDALLGSKGFHPGSKIIITTRDASLTQRCAVFKSNVEYKHTTLKIESLYKYEALELLRLHAFNCSDPKEGYEELVEKLVDYCEGHPLALEVLGKSLYNRDIAYWKECIETLKNEPHRDIRTVLQMSLDSLPFANDKELFKHIACFFVGMYREISEIILKACKINTIPGISNLIERCLVSIDQSDNSLMMHQLLQEMGKAIVREESPDCPGKRSRLWCHDDSFKVLKRKKGTETLKGLVFDPRMLEKEKFHEPWHLKTDAFSNMDNLMILHLNYVQLSGSYENFPEELRWLHLHGFPMKSIPSDIPTEKLVVLDMSYSKIESFAACCTSCNPQPREGGQKLIGSCTKDERSFGSLKILDLSFCEHLHTLCGFYELPALERLIVRNCIGLIEICESLEECVELVHIDLSYCVNLEKLPTAIRKLKKDYKLLLDGCNTRESILQQLVPSAISFPSSLVELSVANCNLTNESFPMDLSCLSRLKHLCLNGNPIVSMPDCVRSLCSLEVLEMDECKTLMSITRPPCTLRRLNVWMGWGRSLLERISFDPDMSPILVDLGLLRSWSCDIEIEGMVKIQPLEGVEQKILSTLGWTHLFDDLLIKSQVVAYDDYRGGELQKFQIQMYYEFGIFSTFYGGQSAMTPISFAISSQKTPISFAIPSSPKKHLRGLNFCYTGRKRYNGPALSYLIPSFFFPIIEIRNVTKNRTWIYSHYVRMGIDVDGEYITYLSHWMFGMNEMEPCDQIIVTILTRGPELRDAKCGVGFVYEAEDGGRMEEEEEDALEYYKSWNHIIGGDLSPFQLTTGEYVLSHKEFKRGDNEYSPFFWGKYSQTKYKENTVPFRAFCKK